MTYFPGSRPDKSILGNKASAFKFGFNEIINGVITRPKPSNSITTVPLISNFLRVIVIQLTPVYGAAVTERETSAV